MVPSASRTNVSALGARRSVSSAAVMRETCSVARRSAASEPGVASSVSTLRTWQMGVFGSGPGAAAVACSGLPRRTSGRCTGAGRTFGVG